MPSAPPTGQTQGSKAGRDKVASFETIYGRDIDEDGKVGDGDEDARRVLGAKKRVGDGTFYMSTQNSLVDDIVFNSDTDGFSSVEAYEARLAQLPQFKNGAGVTSAQQAINKIKFHAADSKYGVLKNAGQVDEVVFGHDIDGSTGGGAQLAYERDEMFLGAYGLPTSAANRNSTMAVSALPDGGRHVKKHTDLSLLSQLSSQDFSFHSRPPAPFDPRDREAYKDAAGVPLTYAPARVEKIGGTNLRPRGNMQHDLGGLDGTPAGRQQRSALADSHARGSVGSIIGASASQPSGHELLGVAPAGTVVAGSKTLEASEARRREQFSQAVRSQQYVCESEFRGAAGSPSDQVHFANTTDLVQRIKPLTKAVDGHGVSEFKQIVFAEKGENRHYSTDHVFHGAAGKGMPAARRTAEGRHGPGRVPQMLDTVDNLLGHELQAAKEQQAQEQQYVRMMDGAAGQLSHELERRSLFARLEGAPSEAAHRESEPKGELKGSILRAEMGRTHAPQLSTYRGAIGASRKEVAEFEATAGGLIKPSRGEALPVRRSAAWSHDSADVWAALNPTVAPTPAREPHAAAPGTAGRLMRNLNDYQAQLIEDQDTPDEMAMQRLMRSSTAVADAIAGSGYYERSNPMDAVVRNPESEEVIYSRAFASRDNLAAQNILKWDANQGIRDESGRVGGIAVNREMRDRLYGHWAPFGTIRDELPGSLGATPAEFLSQQAASDKKVAEATRAALADQHGPAPVRQAWAAYVEAGGVQFQGYVKAPHKADVEAAQRQRAEGSSMFRMAPWGVDAPDAASMYQTSSRAGEAHSPKDGSMASRIAARRMQRTLSSERGGGQLGPRR